MTTTRQGQGLIANIFTDQMYGPSRLRQGPAVLHTFGQVAEVTIVGIIDRREKLGNDKVEPMPRGSQVFPPTDRAPAAVFVLRRSCGDTIVHVEPLSKPEGSWMGPMMGGAYVATSDSRFSEITGMYGAVALHDHYESGR